MRMLAMAMDSCPTSPSLCSPRCALEDRRGGGTRTVLRAEVVDFWIHQQLTPPQALRPPLVTPSPIPMLVNMLAPSRAGEYASWMRVGWCLHDIDADRMLPLWIAFSKRCIDRFVPGECEHLWVSMRDEGYTEASLHMWAKMDSPSEYSIFMHQTVESCNGTHAEIAGMAFSLLTDRYVFCNTRLWFYFDGSVWKQDKEALRIRHELSSTIRAAFVSAGDNVDPSQHRFLKDPGLARAFGHDDALKMEFVRCLFRAYDHDFCFDMPSAVATDSRAYLADNDSVHLFVNAQVVKIPGSDPSSNPDSDPDSSFFTLKEAAALFRSCNFYDHKPRTFKVTLQNLLGVVCHEQKKIKGVNCTNVFMGFRLRWNDDDQQQDQE
eukprot:gene9312-16444_t